MAVFYNLVSLLTLQLPTLKPPHITLNLLVSHHISSKSVSQHQHNYIRRDGIKSIILSSYAVHRIQQNRLFLSWWVLIT